MNRARWIAVLYLCVVIVSAGMTVSTACASSNVNGSFSVSGVSIHVMVGLQGEERPMAGHNVDLTVKLFKAPEDVWSGTPFATYTYVPGADNNTITNFSANASTHIVRFDLVGVAPETYDITIVSDHTLMNVKRTVVVVPDIPLNLGTLLEGNCNNDRQVNAYDFSILAGSYGKTTGQVGFEASADFDRTGQVNAYDFSLLAASYFKYWAPVEIG